MIFMGILMLFATDDIKYKLTKKVSYSWLHRYQQHTVTSSNTQNYSKQAANILTYSIRLTMVSTGDSGQLA